MVLPKEFPVYLWLPFLRHGYFCFHEAAEQKKFSALLNDCIRHLNHGMARMPACSQLGCFFSVDLLSHLLECLLEKATGGVAPGVRPGSVENELVV